MMPQINSVSMPPLPPQLTSGTESAAPSPTFKDMLLNSIQQVNSMQVDANKAVEDLFTGKNANPAEVLTAVQKADLAFRMRSEERRVGKECRL